MLNEWWLDYQHARRAAQARAVPRSLSCAALRSATQRNASPPSTHSTPHLPSSQMVLPLPLLFPLLSTSSWCLGSGQKMHHAEVTYVLILIPFNTLTLHLFALYASYLISSQYTAEHNQILQQHVNRERNMKDLESILPPSPFPRSLISFHSLFSVPLLSCNSSI